MVVCKILPSKIIRLQCPRTRFLLKNSAHSSRFSVLSSTLKHIIIHPDETNTDLPPTASLLPGGACKNEASVVIRFPSSIHPSSKSGEGTIRTAQRRAMMSDSSGAAPSGLPVQARHHCTFRPLPRPNTATSTPCSDGSMLLRRILAIQQTCATRATTIAQSRITPARPCTWRRSTGTRR